MVVSNINPNAGKEREKCEYKDGMDEGSPRTKIMRKIMRAQFLPQNILNFHKKHFRYQNQTETALSISEWYR